MFTRGDCLKRGAWAVCRFKGGGEGGLVRKRGGAGGSVFEVFVVFNVFEVFNVFVSCRGMYKKNI